MVTYIPTHSLFIDLLLYFLQDRSGWYLTCRIEMAHRNKVSKGMLITDNRVVRNVPCAMVVSPLPYWMQNNVPYEATGMAQRMVLISFIVESTRHRRERYRMISGTMISRKAAIR